MTKVNPKTVNNCTPRGSHALNMLLGNGLIDFSKKFQKFEYESMCVICGSNLFHLLIEYGKKLFEKEALRQKN